MDRRRVGKLLGGRREQLDGQFRPVGSQGGGGRRDGDLRVVGLGGGRLAEVLQRRLREPSANAAWPLRSNSAAGSSSAMPAEVGRSGSTGRIRPRGALAAKPRSE